ncbi:MAG TPA: radical SAM protein, partial [Paraburkholderia sp.]|nr:radical SAM protein [Paraburkholderia sp.]
MVTLSADEFPIAPPAPRKGRGAVTNLQGRYEVDQRETFDDGWVLPAADEEAGVPALRTEVFEERAKSIL